MKMEKKSKAEMGESFEVVSKTLRPLKAIAKIIGLILAFFGFLILVLSYAVKYLLEDQGYTDQELHMIFLLVFLVGWLIFGGGLVLCFHVTVMTLPSQNKMDYSLDQYFKNREKPTKSNRFFSLKVNKLIAAILLLTLGFLDLFIITGAIAHHNAPFGNAIVLGGPSYYYPVAFFPHGFGIGLLIYVLFYSHKVNIASSENYFYYNEFKKNSTVNTTIPKSEIEMIRYQNTNINKNYAWILTLIPFSVLTAISGVYLLRAAINKDPTQGILLLVTAAIEIGALFFLALRPAHYFAITTKGYFYQTWFTPFRKKSIEIPLSGKERKEKISVELMNTLNISPTHRQYTKLLIGIFFLVSGLIMLVFYFVVHIFGKVYTMISIIFGTLLIIKAFVDDFSDRNGVVLNQNESDKFVSYERTFQSRFVKIKTLQPTELEVSNQFRDITIYELVLIPILLGFSTIQTMQGWALSTSTPFILNSIMTTAFLCLVYALVFIYICVPTNQLRLKTPTVKYNIPVTLTGGKSRFLEGVLSKDLRVSFLVRCLFIVAIGVVSIVYYFIQIYPYFYG